MKTWSTCMVLGWAVAVALGGPVQLSDIPMEAHWWAHLDIEQFKRTEVGRVFVEMTKEPDIARKLEALKAVFNFDIRTDLNSITACGAGRHTAVIARGRFDEQRLVTLLRAGDGYQELNVDGRTLHSWIDEGKAKKEGREKARMYGAIHRSGAAVISETADAAAHVLKVFDGEAPCQPASASISPAFAPVLLGRLNGPAIRRNAAEKNPVAQGLLSLLAAMGERGTNVEVQIETTLTKPEVAVQIRQIVDGFRAMALLNAEKDPRAARLAEQATIHVDGNTMTLQLSLPVTEITQALRTEMSKKRASTPASDP